MSKYVECHVCGLVWDTLRRGVVVTSRGHPDTIDSCIGKEETDRWREVFVLAKDDGAEAAAAAIARMRAVMSKETRARVRDAGLGDDLERRITALEDAHDALQSEVATLGPKLRETTGLLVDVAAPARRVIAAVDGEPNTDWARCAPGPGPAAWTGDVPKESRASYGAGVIAERLRLRGILRHARDTRPNLAEVAAAMLRFLDENNA